MTPPLFEEVFEHPDITPAAAESLAAMGVTTARLKEMVRDRFTASGHDAGVWIGYLHQHGRTVHISVAVPAPQATYERSFRVVSEREHVQGSLDFLGLLLDEQIKDMHEDIIPTGRLLDMIEEAEARLELLST